MDDLKNYPISITEVVRARCVVERFLTPTQLIRYEGLSKALHANVFVKHENHNPSQKQLFSHLFVAA